MPFPRPSGREVFTAAALVSITLLSFGGGITSAMGSGSTPADWTWSLPLHFPTPFIPADNPMSEAKFQLGRNLFYDKSLSGNGTTSCSSCHIQSLAFTDGKAVSTGSTGPHTPRSSMPIANSVYYATLTWARPDLTSLELQAQVPMFGTNPIELGITGNEQTVLQRFQNNPQYVTQFAAAFPKEANPITFANISKAIATFERGILSGESKYDQYLKGQATLTASELNGHNIFNSEKGECDHCHAGFNFTEQVNYKGIKEVTTLFHNTGLYDVDGKGAYPLAHGAGGVIVGNRGVYDKTHRPADMGAFRAPSLRNVGVTGPYMHDGSIATLAEVVATYAAGGRKIPAGKRNAGDGRLNQFKDSLISRMELSKQDQIDLVAFLQTLTDHNLLTNPRFSNPFAKGSTNNP